MSAAAPVLRRLLLASIAAGPLAYLLLPGLLAPTEIPGAPTAEIYVLLHRWWASAGAPGLQFPAGEYALPADTLGRLLHPLIARFGAAPLLKIGMALASVATLAVAWRAARRVTDDDWAAAAATAVFTASPAVIAGITTGELDALQGWALLVLPLARGVGCLVAGAAVAVLAPSLVPAALLPVVLAVWPGASRARFFPLAGWGLAVALRALLGGVGVVSAAAPESWFIALNPAPSPERVYQIYVGYTACLLLAFGLLGDRGGAGSGRPRAGRGWGFVAIAALLAALMHAPSPPERFLHLVPFGAALAGLSVVGARLPRWLPATAVFVATALVGEGWQGVAAPIPLTRSPLDPIAPVTALVEGPVLDLPATRGAIRRGLWYQSFHGAPIAPNADGLLAPEVAAAAAALSAGGCVDVGAFGYRNLVVRREGALRELAGLRTCLGEPAWDDGHVAVWHVGAGPP